MGVSRAELFEAVGMSFTDTDSKVAEQTINEAYDQAAFKAWSAQEDIFDPVDKVHAWFTSFHASSSPMLNERPCGRYALYRMMAIPSSQPPSQELVTTGDAGKDLERQIMWRLHAAGLLLSPPPNEPQLLFTDSEVWLSGSCDCVMLPRYWQKPLPVEIKGKDHQVLAELISGQREPEPEHVSQLATYVAMAHLAQPELWPELEPIDEGYLVYVSRQRPRVRKSFRVALDLEAYEQARETLAEWKEHFLAGTMPGRDPSWYWTDKPCKWCDLKRICKEDLKRGTTLMGESVAIDLARELRPGYDLVNIREAVLTRWQVPDPDDRSETWQQSKTT